MKAPYEERGYKQAQERKEEIIVIIAKAFFFFLKCPSFSVVLEELDRERLCTTNLPSEKACLST